MTFDSREFAYRLYVLRKPLSALATLLAFVALVYVVSHRASPAVQRGAEQSKPLAEKIRTGETPIPLFTEATEAKLNKDPVFHALAAYTDRGFEPSMITIKRGETVRFTNNSSHDVWIASSGANVQIYPRTQEVCGSSDLDSCEPFAPQDFWQFRFDIAGEWEVVNNLDKSKSAKVIVR